MHQTCIWVTWDLCWDHPDTCGYNISKNRINKLWQKGTIFFKQQPIQCRRLWFNPYMLSRIALQSYVMATWYQWFFLIFLKFGTAVEVEGYIWEGFSFMKSQNVRHYYQIQYLHAVTQLLEICHFVLEMLKRKRHR